MNSQHIDIPNLIKSKNRFIYAIFVLIIALMVGIYFWQQSKISSLEADIAKLKITQLPEKNYTSYEDCSNNGGIALSTVNGYFSACLGRIAGVEQPLYEAFLQYSSQNLPNITERKTSNTENRVTNTANHSADLVAFLKQDFSGCENRGEYEIVKEVPNRFALLKYGCDGDGQVQSKEPPTIIAMKLADGWVLLSPTNNMDENGRPSCLLQDMFRISKDLSPQCFENTGYDNGKLKERNYQ